MTKEEAAEIILNTSFFGKSQEDIDSAIEIAVRCIKGWDLVIEKLPKLVRFESIDGVDLVPVYDVWQLIQNILNEIEWLDVEAINMAILGLKNMTTIEKIINKYRGGLIGEEIALQLIGEITDEGNKANITDELE